MAEWVSVKDRLPEDYVSVLTCDGCGNMHIFYTTQEMNNLGKPFNVGDDNKMYFKPTHWMYLPESPDTVRCLSGNHRPRVYICSPYRGDTVRNIEYARRMCRRAFECGLEPVAPHLYYPQWLDDDEPEERAYGMRRGLELMAGCREVWVCGAVITEGMRAEMEEAVRLGITDIRV